MLLARPFDPAALKLHPFSCGEPELDEWLAKYAGQNERTGNVRTTLLLDEQQGRIAGYYSMRTFELAAADGASATAAASIGFEMVVVHALHEDAACFYLKHGFQRFLDHDLSLFMTTKDLRATFGAAHQA